MPTLTEYTQATQRLLHDPTGASYPVSDVQAYINETRSQLALDAECVRFNFGADGITFAGTITQGTNTILSVTPAATAIADTITTWVVFAPGTITPGTTVTNFNASTITL